MSEKYRTWDVVNYLNSTRDACGYIEACLAEDPGDGSLLRLALNDIARAKETGHLALVSETGDEGLLQSLAETGTLSYATTLAIARALGVQSRITDR